MQISALRGHAGMAALLRAFMFADQAFQLNVMCAVPAEGTDGYHLLLTIGETTAALSIAETQAFAGLLVDYPSGDFQRFGRTILDVLAESPGPHGAH